MKYSAIEVANLRKSFRRRNGLRKSSQSWALDDVSFTVAEGETYGLLGPNGSGKSSLIRILSTLLIADSGEVRLMGHSLPKEQAVVRRIIGRVSVDAAFYKSYLRERTCFTQHCCTVRNRVRQNVERWISSSGWVSKTQDSQPRLKR